jgi:hypothetical protein
MENGSLTSYQFTMDSAIAEWLAQKKMRTGSHRKRQAYEQTILPLAISLKSCSTVSGSGRRQRLLGGTLTNTI